MARVEAGTEQETIGRLQQIYQGYNSGFPFDYKFLDEEYQTQYVAEQRVSVLSRYFAGMAILISCLGLFGLAAYTAEKRIKEIGIRKVLGASEWKICPSPTNIVRYKSLKLVKFGSIFFKRLFSCGTVVAILQSISFNHFSYATSQHTSYLPEFQTL